MQEIPTQIDVSIVIVADRNSFGEIYKQVRIVYGEGKEVGLLDIIPAAYYTVSGDVLSTLKSTTKNRTGG